MPWIKELPFIAYPSNRSPFGYCINGCRRSADIDEFNSNQQQQLGGQGCRYNNVSYTFISCNPFEHFVSVNVATFILLYMQQLSESHYSDSVKEEGSDHQSSNSPLPGDNPNQQLILMEEDNSDQLNFYQNRCKKKKKRKVEIMDLNHGRWTLDQKKSFHLLLQVSFRTFINRMVFKKNFKLFTRRKQFFTLRSHAQTRAFMLKLQRKNNKNFIQILSNYRKLFYDSLDPQYVQNELSKRGIQSEKILTIKQLQVLYNQTNELKKYMLDTQSRESVIEKAMIQAKMLKQQQEKRQEDKQKEIQKQKQAQVSRELMEKFDPKKKKSKDSEYTPKKSKIMCFTMDPLTFQIINQRQIQE